VLGDSQGSVPMQADSHTSPARATASSSRGGHRSSSLPFLRPRQRVQQPRRNSSTEQRTVSLPPLRPAATVTTVRRRRRPKLSLTGQPDEQVGEAALQARYAAAVLEAVRSRIHSSRWQQEHHVRSVEGVWRLFDAKRRGRLNKEDLCCGFEKVFPDQPLSSREVQIVFSALSATGRTVRHTAFLSSMSAFKRADGRVPYRAKLPDWNHSPAVTSAATSPRQPSALRGTRASRESGRPSPEVTWGRTCASGRAAAARSTSACTAAWTHMCSSGAVLPLVFESGDLFYLTFFTLYDVLKWGCAAPAFKSGLQKWRPPCPLLRYCTLYSSAPRPVGLRCRAYTLHSIL